MKYFIFKYRVRLSSLFAITRGMSASWCRETLPLPFGDTVHDEQTVDALKRVQKLAP